MITVSKIVNSAALAVGRLVSQFKETNVADMVTVLAGECQSVEDALWDLFLAYRDPLVATGKTLDFIGALIGAPVRGLRLDASYRNRIAAQININRSSGESGAIYGIAKGVVDAWAVSGQPRIAETGPACYTVRCDPPDRLQNDMAEARELAHVLDEASSAGVRPIVFSQSDTVGAPGYFCFSGGAGAGFGQGAFIGAYDR